MSIGRLGNELRYSLYILLHPFKGFWDLKHEKEGSFFTAMVILLLWQISSILSEFYTEYLFNRTYLPLYNPLATLGINLGLFFGWCISNWAFTCLNDGEGTFKDICTVVAYALVPYIIVQVLAIPLSYFLVMREASLYFLILSVGSIWTGLLIVFGTLVVHQYTFRKTVLVCLVTIAGMGVMAYIGILMLNLVQVILTFFTTLFNEIRITAR